MYPRRPSPAPWSGSAEMFLGIKGRQASRLDDLPRRVVIHAAQAAIVFEHPESGDSGEDANYYAVTWPKEN